jgi:hypothetical protein
MPLDIQEYSRKVFWWPAGVKGLGLGWRPKQKAARMSFSPQQIRNATLGLPEPQTNLITTRTIIVIGEVPHMQPGPLRVDYYHTSVVGIASFLMLVVHAGLGSARVMLSRTGGAICLKMRSGWHAGRHRANGKFPHAQPGPRNEFIATRRSMAQWLSEQDIV